MFVLLLEEQGKESGVLLCFKYLAIPGLTGNKIIVNSSTLK